MPTQHILEKLQLVQGCSVVDLQSATLGGLTDWVCLKNYRRCAVVFMAGIGTNGDDPTLTLLQASAVAGTGSKALTFTTLYVKQALVNLQGTGQWSKVTQAAANTYTQTDAAESDKIWVVDIKDDELDVDNGFDCLRATVADVGGNAQLGTVFYLLHDPRYPDAPENMVSAIID